KNRADLLAKGRWYPQAIVEYRQLIAEGGNEPSPLVQVALANVYFKTEKFNDARQVLAIMRTDQSPAEVEANAQRLYMLAEMARSASDDASHTAFVDELRKSAPQSNWLQEALLS